MWSSPNTHTETHIDVRGVKATAHGADVRSLHTAAGQVAPVLAVAVSWCTLLWSRWNRPAGGPTGGISSATTSPSAECSAGRMRRSSAVPFLAEHASAFTGTLKPTRALPLQWKGTSLITSLFPSSSKGLFSSFKIPKILQDFRSHQIFRRMHGVLNVGKKITNCTVCL
jgi:hypothetical protein